MDNIAIRYYRIAGIGYRVSLPAQYVYPQDAHLAPFRVDACEADRTIAFTLTDALPQPEGTKVFSDSHRTVYKKGQGSIIVDGGASPYLLLERQNNHTHAYVLRRAVPQYITVNLAMTAMELAPDLISRGGFLLHASYIEHRGSAILFTAPSGTGKSTQADLWCRYRGARLLNGDRAGVMVTPEGVYAHGVPFCGSSGVSENVTLPVLAIVSLSQAPRTTISRLTGLRAFRQVWEGCTVTHWNRENMTACTDLVAQTIQRVPVFHLPCTPDESAVAALERAIHDLR